MKRFAAFLLIAWFALYSYFTPVNEPESFVNFPADYNTRAYAETPPIEPTYEASPTKITFVGDIMLDRTIRKYSQPNEYSEVFENIKDLLWESDIVVANLEGPVTDFESVNIVSFC